MVQVILKMRAASGCAAETARALQCLKLAIQSARGLITAELYQGLNDPTILFYLEEWQTKADLREDLVAEHCKRLCGLMEQSADAPVLRVNSFDRAEGIEELAALLQCVSDPDVNQKRDSTTGSGRTIERR